MRNINDIYGKRLKFTRETKAFRRFPGSDSIRIFPAGAVSPPIDSYIQSKFFALKDGADMLYIEDVAGVSVVDSDTPDESGMISDFLAWLKSSAENTSAAAAKNAGFLKSGFQKSISEMGANLETGGIRLFKDVRVVLFLLVLLAIIYTLTTFFKK